MTLNAIEITGGSNLTKFIRLPWMIYRDYPKWVPPLVKDVRRQLDPRRNPFFEYGQVKLLAVADSDGKLLGRIASVLNPEHGRLHPESAGFFGLFECINCLEVAQALFRAVRQHLRVHHCTHMIGPVNFTTNSELGILVEGFDRSPMIMCSYSPPYYAGLLESCGFEKSMDLFSYEGKWDHAFPAKYSRVVSRISSNSAISLRSFSRHNASRDIAIIRDIYNGSFREVWGFVPMSASEARAMGEDLMSFMDEELIWLVEHDRRPAGFILALPDVNEILKDLNGKLFPFGMLKFFGRRRHIRRIRVVVLAVLPEFRSIGIEALLIHKVHERVLRKPYQGAEFSVVNENNTRMRSILTGFGFRVANRYRLYRAPVEVVENDTAPL
jgi:ribosomal protein S18 acetylase RimI-like enzyme